jgi:hypothetical protein
MSIFKILTTFSTVIEAEITQLLLEEYGIESTVLDSNLAYSLGATYSQGIRLQVKEEDFEKAAKIYQASLDKSENDLDYT